MINQRHTIDNNRDLDRRVRQRQFGIAATALALGTVVLAACGVGTAETHAVAPAAKAQSVSQFLSDPGPGHQPDHGLLDDILEGRYSTPSWTPLVYGVEFGGMPAPVGEPTWGARSVQPLPVEFGGMPAPVGEPVAFAPAVPDGRDGGPR